MARLEMSRRKLLVQGGSALAGLSVLRLAGPASAFQDASGGEVIPWLDQPEPNPLPEVIVSQSAPLDFEAVHEQPACVVTSNPPLPAPAGSVCDDGWTL